VKLDGIDHKGWLALSRIEGLGPVSIIRLIDRFKEPRTVFRASIEQLTQVTRIGVSLAKKIKSFDHWQEVDREIEQAKKHGVRILCLQDDDYPLLLARIPAPPPLIYVKGSLPESEFPVVAIVGTRTATPYGLKAASMLSRGLAQCGVAIVSGLARGVDSAAHSSCLDCGTKTVAVLGCGADVIYPPENKKLYERICSEGAIVSEFPMGTRPDARNFPRRNRIISGLSRAVIVVEAGNKSGALITSSYALQQNREVFAVPGPITSSTSVGANRLIREGAGVATSATDILADLSLNENVSGELNKALNKKDGAEGLTPEQKKIFNLIGEQPVNIDHLIVESGMKAPEVSGQLLNLQLKGIVTELAGKQYVRS
jgi:DNA processing protein